MANKWAYLGVGLVVFTSLGACQSIPNPEKAKMYDASMREKFVGKHFDNVVMALGPPNSNFTMSDGRLMYQYHSSKTSNYSSGGSVYYGGSYGGRNSSYGLGIGFPFPLFGGTNQYTHTCTKRFIVNDAKIVQDFKFEGNSCY